MRGEEEVFCSNADVQFSFPGEFVFSPSTARAKRVSGAAAGHTTSAVFLSLKNPNVTSPIAVLLPTFSSHMPPEQIVLQQVLDGVGDAAIPGFAVQAK